MPAQTSAFQKLRTLTGKYQGLRIGAWYVVGNFLARGLNFIALPFYAHLLLPDDFGRIAVYNSWVGLLTILAGINLYAVVDRGILEFSGDRQRYVSSTLALAFLVYMLLSALAIILPGYATDLFSFAPLVILQLLFQGFSTHVVNFYTTELRLDYQAKRITLINLPLNALIVALSIPFIIYLPENKYLGRIWGGSIAYALFAVPIFIFLLRRGRSLFVPKYWRFALSLALPLLPHSLSGILLSQIDRIILQDLVGATATGLYSFAFQIGSILQVIWVSTNATWLPWFLRRMQAEDYRSIQRYSGIYIAGFTVVACGLMLASPELAAMFGPKEYQAGSDIIPLVCGGFFFLFLYSLPANVEFYKKKMAYISLGTAFAALCNISLNYALIPKYGIHGSAIATVCSYAALFLYHYLVARRMVPVLLFDLRRIAISTAICLAVMLLTTTSQHLLTRAAILAGLVAVFAVMLRRFFQSQPSQAHA